MSAWWPVARLFLWRCAVILLSCATLATFEGLLNGPRP